MCAVLLYGLSMIYSVFLWRRGFREDSRINYSVLLGGFAFHTVAMVARGFSFNRCPVNNLYEAITFVLWTIVVAYLVIGLLPRIRFLGAFASPVLFCLGVFALMPGLDTPYTPGKPEFKDGWASLHAALILLSYGAFGLGSVAGLMYLSQDNDLKFHKLRAILSRLPPIHRLEIVISRLVVTGFILLTLGLTVGAIWLKLPPGMGYFSDIKVIWSVFIWLVYLAMIVSRWKFDQRGRRFAWGAIGSFAFIMLTFWGSNLASSIHNP